MNVETSVEAKNESGDQNPLKKTLWRMLPWAGTVALVAYILATTDFEAFFKALLLADIPTFLSLYLLFFGAHLLLDSLGIGVLLKKAGIGLPIRRLIIIRAASYMLGFINYNLGLVLLAAAAGQGKKVRWERLASPFLALNAIDLFVMGCVLIYGTMSATNTHLPDAGMTLMKLAAFAAVAVLPVALVLARMSRGWPGFIQGLLDAFKMLDWKGVVPVLLLRFAFLLTGAAGDFVMLRTFNLDVPLQVFAQFFPVDSFACVLPVSMAGVGPTLVLMRVYFAPWASGGTSPLASIDAFSISLTTTMIIVRTIGGLVALPFATGYFRKGHRNGSLRNDASDVAPETGRER